MKCDLPGLSQNLQKTAASSWFTSSQSILSNLAEVRRMATHAGAGLQTSRAGLATSSSTLLIETCHRACSSLGTTSSSLASGCSKTASASQTTGSQGRKNGTLLATTKAVSLTMLLEVKMQQKSILDQCNRQSRSWRAPPSNTLFDMYAFA